MALTLARVVNTFSRKSISFARKDSKLASSLVEKCGIFTHTQVQNIRPISTLFGSTKCNDVLLKNSSVLFKTQNGYASLHTEGDRRFAELLSDEIKEEKKQLVDLPQMSDGWKVSLKGAEGSLTKNHDGDKIEVTFSLNGSLPPIPMDDQDAEEAQDEKILSYPEFNVKITKSGNSKVVEFDCYFPEDVQEGVADESLSMFSIRNAVIYEGEISDSTYMMETENLDPDVYSYFLTFLADRSVDEQFAQEFVDLASAAEQREYIRSLEMLKDFVSSN